MTETAAALSIGGLLAEATARLRDVSSSPRLDAELLLGEALGVGRERLVIDRDVPVDTVARERFAALITRRAACEPVAYLLGRQGFRWLELDVDSRVLVPRPESELLVEIGLGLAEGSSVLEVGTGSGAVALALAHERPDLTIRGVDVSDDALAVARRNASRLDLDVSFTLGDLLVGSAPADAVLANLPYVEDDARLPDDVARYEPALALYGGADGLTVIRRLVAMTAGRPWPALLALEIGETHGARVSALVTEAGFSEVEVRRDLTDRDRVVVGRR